MTATLYCVSADGCSMEVDDEVKAILDLVVPGYRIFIENRPSAIRQGTCYIDVEPVVGEHISLLNMSASFSWEDAQRHFVRWVLDGCKPNTHIYRENSEYESRQS